MLAFSNDYYGIIFRATQSVELFCAYEITIRNEKLIDFSDPVYTFCEVIDHIDLSRYFVENLKRLKTYVCHIEICEDKRNRYSKTD